jgi:hypothetical protein
MNTQNSYIFLSIELYNVKPKATINPTITDKKYPGFSSSADPLASIATQPLPFLYVAADEIRKLCISIAVE